MAAIYYFPKLSVQGKYLKSREFINYVQGINGFRLASLYMGPVDVVIEGSHWVENLLDYLVLKHPSPFISVLFVSVISTFLFKFCNCFLFLFLLYLGGFLKLYIY